MVDRPGFEPGASASLELHSIEEKSLPRRRSTADLPAHRSQLDKAGAGDIFASPTKFPDSARNTEPTGSTSFLPDVVGSTATTTTANMSFLVLLSEGGRTLTHCSSLFLFLSFFCRGFD